MDINSVIQPDRHDEEASTSTPEERIPGEQLPRGTRIQSKALLLLYDAEIPILEYKEAMRSVIVKYCKGSVLTFESYQKRDNLCCVLISASAAILTRKSTIFDWKGVFPRIHVLKGESQIALARVYIELDKPRKNKQKQETSGLRTRRTAAVRMAIMDPYSTPEPEVRVDHFRDWQIEALKLMDENTKRVSKPLGENESLRTRRAASNVHIVYINRNETVGRTAFLVALRSTYPERFLVVKDIPSEEEILRITRDATSRGWNGDTILFDMTSDQRDGTIHGTLKAVSGNTYALRCNNVWVFTSIPPDLTPIHTRPWKLLQITTGGRSNTRALLKELDRDTASDIRERTLGYAQA